MMTSEAMAIATIIENFMNIDAEGRECLLVLSKGLVRTSPKLKAPVIELVKLSNTQAKPKRQKKA